ncbi:MULTISPECIES: PAS domain S-box protein [unclassified Sphingomonas]|uniref:PAS domain S-box protein n=1 Tax=unclassified Sphingomonas TaxID=196159 RepID=UPI000829ECFD|nr:MULTISPECIES: PAS domain S-box protein [unclassified Sphingomonas]
MMQADTHNPEARRHLSRVAYVTGVTLLFGVLAYLGVALTRDSSRIAAVWLPNAVLVALLLRRDRPDLLLNTTAFAANVLANLLAGDMLSRAIGLSAVNTIEIMSVTILMRHAGRARPDMSKFSDLMAFTLFGGLVAPAFAGFVAAMVLGQGVLAYEFWITWALTDALGLLLLAPSIWVAIDAWNDRAPVSRERLVEWFLVMSGGFLVVVGVFAQSRFPLLYVATPVVLLAAFRLGGLGAAAATLMVAVIASIATWSGSGPITLVKGDMAARLHTLQGFLVVNFGMSLPVAVALAGRAAIARALTQSEELNRSMLDNMREVIFKTDAQGRWIFLNPAWEALTGYTVAESLGWRTTRLLHPDDRAMTATVYPDFASGKLSEATFRQRFFRRSGELAHIEVSIRRLADAQGNFIGTTGNIRNVTEAVLQERALADSEARFRMLAESAPVGIFRANSAGALTYINPSWAAKLGKSVEAMLGNGWMEAVADLRPLREDPPFRNFKPGMMRRRMIEFRAADGTSLWMETYNAAQFDEDERVIGYFGAAVDVTEQKRAIEQLRASELRFQTLANLAPAGIFRTDAAGSCTYVNQAWLGLTGLGDGDWQGDGWAAALHPDDRDRVSAAWREAVSERTVFREEFRWRKPDGSIVWVDTVGRPEVDDKGDVIGFIGVNLDVTSQKAALAALAERDQQLTLITDNVTDAVVRLSLDGTCLYASPSSATLFEVPADALVGANLLADFHPDEDAQVRNAFAALVAGDMKQVLIAFRSAAPTDRTRYRWMEANCAAVQDPETGRPVEIIASIRDVSRTKAIEAQLVAARRQAEDAANAKSSFLANMSHEIRTPMNGVIGFTELLAATPLDDEQRRHVNLIAESGRAMMRLLNDILDISKIEAGQMQLADEPIGIRHKLRAALQLMEPIARAKGVALRCTVDDAVPRFVIGDPLRVRQVVLNLVGNAVKFTEHGHVHVDVTVARAPSGDELRIDVADTGIGIPPDRVGTIFEKFSQADGSIVRKFGGTGLGLSISTQLVAMMGGRITVQSELGKGAIFSVFLPLRVAQAPAAADWLVGAEPPTASPLSPPRRPRILVAEDYDINQALIQGIARQLAFDVAIAGDGARAVAMVREAADAGRPYDLVLMDIQMPVMDGLEATRRLRAEGFDAGSLPIVALTANAYAEDVAACLAAGMQAHLSKPVRTPDLKQLIDQYLDVRSFSDVAASPPLVEAQHVSLEQRYVQRRDETLDMIASLGQSGAGGDDDYLRVIDLLHKLAGTAGMFGEPALGDAAAALENALRDAGDPASRHLIIRTGLDDLRHAG